MRVENHGSSKIWVIRDSWKYTQDVDEKMKFIFGFFYSILEEKSSLAKNMSIYAIKIYSRYIWEVIKNFSFFLELWFEETSEKQ